MRAPVAWVRAIGLGLGAGALSAVVWPAAVLGAIAAASAIVLRGWPLRASIGGLCIGAGAAIAVAQSAAFAACLPDESVRSCAARTSASYAIAETAAAVLITGVAASLVAINVRGGAPSSARVRGGLLALAIAFVVASAEGFFQRPAGGRFDALGIALLSGSGAPTVTAALITGWLLGPTASLRKTRLEWAWLAVGMALAAIVVGAVAVGLGMGLERAIWGGSGASAPFEWLAYGLLLALVGIIFVGPFAFPIVLCASLLWTRVMARTANG